MTAFVIAVIVLTAALTLLSITPLVRFRAVQLATYGSPLFLLSIHLVDGEWWTAFRLALLTVMLIAGYFAVRALVRNAVPSDGTAHDVRVAPAVVSVAVALSAYHFLKVGIPALSAGVEVDRFNLGSSGLFGLPSRMYLFGLFIATALALAEARAAGTAYHRDLWVRIAFGAILLTRLMSGFKSGIVQVVLYTLLLTVLLNDGIRLNRYLARTLLATAAAIGFVLISGATYQSYQSSGRSITASIENRLTSESAEPVWLVVNATPDSLGEDRGPIALDLAYFAGEYLHLPTEQPYGFTRLIAARAQGQSAESADFLPPVTLSAAAVLYYQFGWWALIACLGVGGLLAYSEKRAYLSARSPMRFAMWAALAEATIEFVSKGELVYAVLNWGATCGVLAAVAVGWRAVMSRYRAPVLAEVLVS